MSDEFDRKEWRPGGGRKSRMLRRRIRERKAREHVMGLTLHQRKALLKAITERGEMPTDLTLELWEELHKPSGFDRLGDLLEKKIGMDG